MVRLGQIGFFLDDQQLRFLLGEDKCDYVEELRLRAKFTSMDLVFLQIAQGSTDFLIGRNQWKTINQIPSQIIADLNERLASFSFRHGKIHGRMLNREMPRWYAQVSHSDLVILKMMDARL